MTQPSVTLGYHTFVGEYKLGDEITTFSIPALKEHDNGVRDKVLDEIFPKHTKTLEDGWIYNSVLRHKLEHAIAERNEWDLGEEEIEEVLMVFEEELRQEGKDSVCMRGLEKCSKDCDDCPDTYTCSESSK